MEKLPIDLEDLKETFKSFGLWETPIQRVTRIFRQYLDESSYDFSTYAGEGFQIMDLFHYLKHKGYEPKILVTKRTERKDWGVSVLLEEHIIRFRTREDMIVPFPDPGVEPYLPPIHKIYERIEDVHQLENMNHTKPATKKEVKESIF